MKFMRWAFLLAIVVGMTLHAACAQAAPRPMSVSCTAPYPDKQRDLKRPRGDSDTWTFSLSLAGDARFVDGPYWSYPGKGGNDPDWGTWSGGQDGSSSLSWAAPQKTGSFSVRVNGKIVCGEGGDGEPIPFEAGWDGDVVAKDWKADSAIEGGELVKPQDQTASPATPAIVLVKTGSTVDCEVTEATDKDSWTEGDDEGEEDDTIKYKWTASGGGFVTSEHPIGDAPFAETRSAQWKAPTEPGDYTLECTIDDLPKELSENETGTRDDDAVKRTLQVKVVKMEFVPPVIRLYVGDTKEVDVLIAPEDASSLFTFSMLDTSVATHSGAPVTFTITGVAAGNTKFQAKYDNKMFDEATVIVKEHIDEETDDLDDDGIPDIFDDDIDGDGIIDNTPAKLWSPDTGISGGEFGVTEVTVAAGGTVGLEVTQAGDSDKWRQGNDSGHEPDSVHYNWSATGGSVTPDSSEPWKSTFTAPNESGEYYVKVKIDDEPAAVISPDKGRRDDSAVTRTVKVIVQQKKWDIDLEIGKYRQEDGNVLENGRLIAPLDQRVNPATPETVTVAAGKTVNLEVEAATDIDHWEEKYGSNPGEGYDEDEVTYTWSATGGTVTPDPTDPKKATWQAPNDDGDYTVKVTIDDVPKAIPAGEGGTRDDDSVERSVKIKVAPFKIEWEGLARAVAGGVALDGAHDFTITGTAKRDDDTVVANAELKLTFEGNKGHDYSGDEEWIKPAGWTAEQIKRAKFVKAGPPLELVEELTVTTDAEGKFSVHVLGSDIISTDIKIKVTWKDENDSEKDVGEKECDFAEDMSYRRFPNPYDPDEIEDTGWLFNNAWLAPNSTTTAKIYMICMKDPTLGDVYGNWHVVNGHRMKFEIDRIILKDETVITNNFDDYAILHSTEVNGMTINLTQNDGAATSLVTGKDEATNVEIVWMKAIDLNQWTD